MWSASDNVQSNGESIQSVVNFYFITGIFGCMVDNCRKHLLF
jgi:hypothetical protein